MIATIAKPASNADTRLVALSFARLNCKCLRASEYESGSTEVTTLSELIGSPNSKNKTS